MIPAQLAALVLPLLPLHEVVDPSISIQFRSGIVHFDVEAGLPAGDVFAGAVVLSMDSSQCIYFEGVPPLLCDAVVLGVGVAKETLRLSIEERRLPLGFFIYAQGVVADQRLAVTSTEVLEFILDGGAPPSIPR